MIAWLHNGTRSRASIAHDEHAKGKLYSHSITDDGRWIADKEEMNEIT